MWSLYIPVFLVSTSSVIPGDRLCEWGKYGEHCNLTCPVNCALVQPRNVKYCDRNTGKCLGGCQNSWHGGLCDQSCSTSCRDKTCNQQTGHCTLRCYGNNMGVFCNGTQECGRGWYGDTCGHPCSRNCVEERCNQTTGVCTLGCNGTYTGEFCDIITENFLTPDVNKKEEIITDPVFLVAVLAVVLVVIVATVVQVMLFLRSRRHKKSSQRSYGPREVLQTTENSPLTNNNHGEVAATSVV